MWAPKKKVSLTEFGTRGTQGTGFFFIPGEGGGPAATHPTRVGRTPWEGVPRDPKKIGVKRGKCTAFLKTKKCCLRREPKESRVPPSPGGTDLKKKPAGEALKSDTRELSRHAIGQGLQLFGMKKRHIPYCGAVILQFCTQLTQQRIRFGKKNTYAPPVTPPEVRTTELFTEVEDSPRITEQTSQLKG